MYKRQNLISGLHTFMAQIDQDYQNLIPPLKLLNENEKKIFFDELQKLDFDFKHLKAA